MWDVECCISDVEHIPVGWLLMVEFLLNRNLYEATDFLYYPKVFFGKAATNIVNIAGNLSQQNRLPLVAKGCKILLFFPGNASSNLTHAYNL